MEAMMKDIYTISLCKINSINANNSFMEVFCIATKTIITDVPLMQLGNATIGINVKLKVGDIIPVLHIKEDLSLFLSQGTEEPNDTLNDFSQSNAIGLPFKIPTFNENYKMPQYDVDIIGSLRIKGELIIEANAEHAGDLTISGNIKATGNVEATGDVKAGNISLRNHQHNVQVSTQTGTGSTIGTPF